MTSPALAHNVRGRGRHYTNPATDEVVPSITNVIGVLDKPALPRWSAKMVAEAAWTMRHSLDGMGETEAIDVLKGAPWRNSGRAADRGTSIHDYLEARAEGTMLPKLEGDALRYRKGADQFLEQYRPEFVRTEFTVFSDDGYAGTADFMAWIDGRLVIGDHKTSKALYPEIALQLAAIRFAHSIVTDDGVESMPEVDGCVGVLITPDGCEVREITADVNAHRAFLACLSAWEWRKGPKPVGDVVPAPGEVAA